MFEVEQKFRVEDVRTLESQLERLGAHQEASESHRDTYYNHPSRDFGSTREALRIRRVNGTPMLTYKGPKLPGDVKARRELEWRLDPGDSDGTKTEELWVLLGFRRVETVVKERRPFGLPAPWADATVVIDCVERLGTFAEVEMIAKSEDGVENARRQILDLAAKLGLHAPERRSYLRILLQVDQAK